MTTDEVPRGHELLVGAFGAAVAAVHPSTAFRGALRRSGDGPIGTAPAVLAIGKAAGGMARELEQWIDRRGSRPVDGLVIGAEGGPPIATQFRVLAGDHPVPGHRSAVAAEAISAFVAALPSDTPIHVALSGGASALVASPLPGISVDEMNAGFQLLLGSALPIGVMNAARKRLTRWSAGRLARALGGRPVSVWAISDVPGDDPSDIGSGPCSGDPWDAGAVIEQLRQASVWDQLPAAVRGAFAVETLKPEDRALAHVTFTIVARNRDALQAAADFLRAQKHNVRIFDAALHGDAAAMGTRIGRQLNEEQPRGQAWIWGGETTVRLGADAGIGGRSQELALAAAKEMRQPGVTLLAAGTDGRDGVTDAAGAIVDGATWLRAHHAGLDPDRALAGHDAYRALNGAGALLRTGPTGTNVMDIAIGVTEAE